MTGIAAGLLFFTGLWHALEWLMSGRNRDTIRLIPVGIIYALLGWFIADGAGWIVQVVALALVALGMVAAFATRKRSQLRGWVTWAFILIDLVIIAALIAGLLGL